MLLLNIKNILKARGIEQAYTFLVKSGFVPFTAHKYKNSKVEHIRLDHIERLCILLNCTPNELFEWIPNDLMDDRPNHPLQKIRRRDKRLDLHKMIANIPVDKFEEVEKLLASVN
jgi:DNA-binding Xre family transcriptional regulator